MASNSEKVTVWCAMFVNQVFGPYYFDSFIVSGIGYKHILTSYFFSMLPGLPVDTIFSRTGNRHITVWKCTGC